MRSGELSNLRIRPYSRVPERAKVQVGDLLLTQCGEPGEDVGAVETIQKLGSVAVVAGLITTGQGGPVSGIKSLDRRGYGRVETLRDRGR